VPDGQQYNGEDGVGLALRLLYDEFFATMTMVGVISVAEIGPQHLARISADGFLIPVDEGGAKAKL
jgi:isopentenyl diphosphate isomerase/L-lactate dehydrogenase-like FMN-dependent dehydrogenase